MGLKTGNTLKKLEKAPDEIDDRVNQKVKSTVKNMSITAQRLAPTVDRTLRNSIDTHHQGGTHILRASADHAAYVEYGTGQRGNRLPLGGSYKSPSLPPYSQIIDWVKAKPLISEDMSQESLGAVIAETIAQKGTHPHPYMRPTIESHRDELENALSEGVNSALRKTF